MKEKYLDFLSTVKKSSKFVCYDFFYLLEDNNDLKTALLSGPIFIFYEDIQTLFKIKNVIKNNSFFTDNMSKIYILKYNNTLDKYTYMYFSKKICTYNNETIDSKNLTPDILPYNNCLVYE